MTSSHQAYETGPIVSLNLQLFFFFLMKLRGLKELAPNPNNLQMAEVGFVSAV